MNILMVTNTFLPHVGGVARSVSGFTAEFRKRGHRVVVVAPIFEGIPERETDVVRIPAVQNFNGSDFSVPVLSTGKVIAALKRFTPEIVHSHHPFLLGDTALRVAATRDIPVVFTHHTMYEKYTHYVPGDSPRLKRFVLDLVTGYCNLCDAVIAPSKTVAEEIVSRGVKVPVNVIPTGVNVEVFGEGDGGAFRKRMEIPPDAFLVGHVGRLAPEKNLEFLTRAVVRFLLENRGARFFLAGEGPLKKKIEQTFADQGLADRFHFRGVMDFPELASAYQSMDVFAFASCSETQGMVLTEAMAADTPVVALDASGVREVVRDKENGRLLPREDEEEFVSALSWVAGLSPEERQRLGEGVARTADSFSLANTAEHTLALYGSLIGEKPARKTIEPSPWASARKLVEEEWKIVRNIAHAAGHAVLSLSKEKKSA
ncbi:MAG: glycosyltransferase [Deltaproteobacteria bacterium]|nr:glycosyltransferase [Deltaproteobacteria bacterium]MDH3382622.1 glycosyltransferase [Deltaproteobacteria bacterium]